jgi:hypothetical protein
MELTLNPSLKKKGTFKEQEITPSLPKRRGRGMSSLAYKRIK